MMVNGSSDLRRPVGRTAGAPIQHPWRVLWRAGRAHVRPWSASALASLSVLGVLTCGVSYAQDGGTTGSATPPADPAPAAAPAESPEEAAIPREFLRDLHTAEAQVHDLQERVFRSKATLELLRELVVEGSGTGSTLKITHVDDLTRDYTVEGVQYYLDGKPVFTWALSDGTPIPDEGVTVEDGAVAPGTHAVQVTLSLRGNGGKMFDYVQDYRFKVESSYSFEVQAGMSTKLTVHAVAKGGVKKAFTERPTVQYEVRSETVRPE